MGETKLTINTRPWDLGGDGVIKDDKTILQDAARATALAFLTVMAEIPASGKLTPLIDINQVMTAAKLTCGANGGNLAAWQAVSDGEFKLDTDGTLHSITGVDTSGIAALTDILPILQAATAGLFTVSYDVLGDVFIFTSLTMGITSTISYLTAGAAGTDISGAGFLNGLTGTGVITPSTGDDGADEPAGIFMGDEIAAATIVAGDVDDQKLMIGKDKMIDEDMIVLEGGLTLDSVITRTGLTIRKTLSNMGIYPRKSQNAQQIQPIA